MTSSRLRFVPVIEQILVSAGNFLLIALSARALAPIEQGKLAYVIAFAIGARTLLRLSVCQNMYAVAPRKSVTVFRPAMTALGVGVSLSTALIVTASLYLLIGDRFEGWSPTPGEMGIVAAYILTSTLFDYERAAAYVFSGDTRAAALSAFVYPVRSVVLFVAPLHAFTDALLICAIVNLTVLAGLARTLLSARSRLPGLWPEMREHLVGSRWLVASMPVSFLRAQSPVMLVGEFLGLAASGVLLTVRSITNIANVGLELLATYLSAVLGRAHADDRSHYRYLSLRILGIGLLAWTLGAVVLLTVGEEILGVVSAGRYTQEVPLLLWLWAGMALVFGARLLHVHLRQIDRTRSIAVSQYLAAGITIAAVSVLTPAFGIVGAGIGIAAGSATMLIWSAIGARA